MPVVTYSPRQLSRILSPNNTKGFYFAPSAGGGNPSGISSSTPAVQTILDFVNGIYKYNGNTVLLADAIDTPARVSASGLSCLQSNPVNLIGSFLSLVSTGAFRVTFTFTLSSTAAAAVGRRVNLMTALSNSAVDNVLFYSASVLGNPAAMFGSTEDESTAGSSTRNALDSPSPFLVVGSNTMLGVRTPSKLSVASNGHTESADNTTSNGIIIDYVELADRNFVGGTGEFIRSITFEAL